LVVEGEARQRFGDALAATMAEHRPDLAPSIADRIRAKAFVAPTLIAFASHCDPSSRLPPWEQVASAACVGYAITLAAHHLGLGAMWKSIPASRGRAIGELLDMGPDDEFLGWINLGQLPEDHELAHRPQVELGDVVRHLR